MKEKEEKEGQGRATLFFLPSPLPPFILTFFPCFPLGQTFARGEGGVHTMVLLRRFGILTLDIFIEAC